MKKSILSVSMLLMTSSLFSQWIQKTVVEDSEKYNIAYCDSKETPNVYCKLEKVNGEVLCYLSGGYFCEDEIEVTLDFLIGTQWKQFEFKALKSSSSKSLYIIENLMASDCFQHFNICNTLLVGIKDFTCGVEFYTFNMKNSTKSCEFVNNQ